MNLAARDRGEGVSVSSLESEAAPAEPFEAKRQRLSLVVAVLFVAFYLFTSLWIAFIRQLSVTVDGVVTAPPQFVAD